MASDISAFHPLLKQGDFGKLFNELGWDRLKTGLMIPVGEAQFQLLPIAEKRGVQIFQCLADASGKIPEYAVRRKIEAEVTKSAFHHVIVFTDGKKTTQIWQWVAREAGKALSYREQAYDVGQSGEPLLQKLERISFPLSEEEGLTLSGVAFKLKDAFNKDNVTKKFYDRFKKEHDAFLEFVKNIPDTELQRWYASVMINRLMFLYFIQAKGFLDSDLDYLKHKLHAHPGHFYKDFLCPLFFDGFAQRDHSPETKIKLGKVPYLNGGLFAKHQIEEQYGAEIVIPDSAFKALFTFFDDYNWHLDDRPLKNDKEINPDVLGYIFEKYINQKQMGAYYTKEDITEYIGKNTILPFLLDRAREDCQVAFEGQDGLWRLLRENPDRYFYTAVKHGIHDEHGTELPLPASIAQGIENVAARGDWNKPAPSEFGLPTEIWREVVARRQRHDEVRAKLAAGEVRDVADLITYNLNIRQFTQDCIEQGGSDFLLAVWNVLNGTKEGRLPMSVLDPTCGSGAFLFAALEILDPLYEACLDRMASFVSDADQLGHTKVHPRFRKILKGVAAHKDRRYFVLKSIIVNNLFGVDIMEEATEICKLRLFLTLAAQVEADSKAENFGIEPLPDIDFNIRAGNTLVGFATEKQTETAVKGRLDFDNAWPRIQSKAAAVAKQFEAFHKSQSDQDADPVFVSGMKQGLRDGLKPLREELDTYLGQQYGKISKESAAAWKKSAQPFHWFIEFYNVIRAGGFDVIIGNPPYVEYTKKDSKTKKSIMDLYQVKGYDTLGCGNLYAFTMERCIHLCNDSSRSGMIVPSSAFSTGRMRPLTALYARSCTWFSFYDFRPAKLFDGVNLRLAIFLTKHKPTVVNSLASTYNRWYFDERHDLFESRLSYRKIKLRDGMAVKTGRHIESGIYSKIVRCSSSIAKIGVGTKHRLYFHDAILYWIRATDFVPSYDDYISSHVKTLSFGSIADCRLACSLMNSTLFYWWWVKISNCRDLSPDDAESFQFPSSLIEDKDSILVLHERLMEDLQANSQIKVRVQKQTGEVKYREFNPVMSKFIIDQIDRVLAKHYGFTDEETDFIINYDIKYRMGRGGDEENGE